MQTLPKKISEGNLLLMLPAKGPFGGGRSPRADGLAGDLRGSRLGDSLP